MKRLLHQLSLCLLIGTILVLGGCPVPPTPETPYGKKYTYDPVTRGNFYMYVPSSYTHDKPMPVIVSCHGTPPFDIAEHHIRTWKWYGEEYDCIIVCPELEGTDGILGDGPIIGMLNNERKILSILSTLSYKLNIDRANIMITGFSGGGFPAYWVGLRHPDVFRTVVAQNCNFSRSNIDGWYPPDAVRIPVMVYYGENDPATIVAQSREAIEYLRSRGFKVTTDVIPGAGHDRHPEVAMRFFREHWVTPQPTMRPRTSTIPSPPAYTAPTPRPQIPTGPRPPVP